MPSGPEGQSGIEGGGTAMELVGLARNPVPSGAVIGRFPGYDGAPLRFARWQATRSPKRGTVCVFTGRTEFIEKYFEVITDLRRRGFAVAMMDWRGQGASHRPLDNPRKGFIRDFSEYDRDLKCFMRQIVLPDCPPPYFALGHSMGGHILVRNAMAPGNWFERIILAAPMLKLHEKALGTPEWAAKLYAETGTLLGFGGSYVHGGSDQPSEGPSFEANILTSDRERWTRNVALIQAAPHLALGSPTIGWLRAAFRSMQWLSAPVTAARVAIPMMIFVAGSDSIVEPSAVDDFANRLKSGTRVLLSSSRHEILQESEEIRSQFWAAFDAYMGVESIVA